MFTFASVNDVCLMDFDGSTIASGHLDNNLRFWDARSGNCVKEVTGIHLGQITSVCPSADGSQILTNSRDNTLRILDVRTYETLSVLHADGYKTGTNWSKACFRYTLQKLLSCVTTYSLQACMLTYSYPGLLMLDLSLALTASMLSQAQRMEHFITGLRVMEQSRRRPRISQVRSWVCLGSTVQS